MTAAKRKQDTKTSFKILKMFFSQEISVRDLSALPRNEQDQDCRSLKGPRTGLSVHALNAGISLRAKRDFQSILNIFALQHESQPRSSVYLH